MLSKLGKAMGGAFELPAGLAGEGTAEDEGGDENGEDEPEAAEENLHSAATDGMSSLQPKDSNIYSVPPCKYTGSNIADICWDSLLDCEEAQTSSQSVCQF